MSKSLKSSWHHGVNNIKFNLLLCCCYWPINHNKPLPDKCQPTETLHSVIDCARSQSHPSSSSAVVCRGVFTQQASLSGAVRRDADAEEPPWSVASSFINVFPHALLFEAASLCWPLSRGAAVVSSGAAAGGSRRRGLGDGHPKLEAVHLRGDGLNCRRIR